MEKKRVYLYFYLLCGFFEKYGCFEVISLKQSILLTNRYVYKLLESLNIKIRILNKIFIISSYYFRKE